MAEVKDTLTLDTNALDVFNKIMGLIDNTIARIQSLNSFLDGTGNSSSALDSVAGAVGKIGSASSEAQTRVISLGNGFSIASSASKQLGYSSDSISSSLRSQGSATTKVQTETEQYVASIRKAVAGMKQFASNPIQSASSAIGGVLTKITHQFIAVEAKARQTGRSIKESFSNFGSGIKSNPLETIVGSMVSAKNAIGGGFKNVFNSMGSGLDNIKNKLTSMPAATQSWQMSLMGVKAAIDLIKMGIGAVKGFIGFSDNLTQTKARVGLVNDGLYETDEVMRQIADSALRTGGNMDVIANSVSQLRANAGDVFTTPQDAIAFSENLNKIFAFSGTSSTGAESVMYNLTQALSTGVLRGQDFNAVLSNAPAIIQYMADEMDVPISKMREMANNGELSADIVRNALMNATDDINAKFDEIPMTFGRAFNMVKTEATMAFLPVNEAINELVSSDDFMKFIDMAIGGFQALASIVQDYVIPAISSGMAFINENIDYVVAALVTLGAVGAAMALVMLVNWMIALWPLFLIIGIVLAIVAVLKYFGFTGTEIFGMFVGGLNVVIQTFKNLGLMIANIALGIWESLKAAVGNIIKAFKNAGLNIKAFFQGLVATILGMIANIAEALSKLPFVEFDYEGLRSQADGWAASQAETLGQKEEYENLGDAWDKGFNTFDAFKEGWASDAYNSGYSTGENLAGSFGGFDIQNTLGGMGGGGGLGGASAIDSIGDVGKVGSVGKIDEDVTISEEDLRLLKDVRQREILIGITTPTAMNFNNYGDTYGEDSSLIHTFMETMKDGEANVTVK